MSLQNRFCFIMLQNIPYSMLANETILCICLHIKKGIYLYMRFHLFILIIITKKLNIYCPKKCFIDYHIVIQEEK